MKHLARLVLAATMLVATGCSRCGGKSAGPLVAEGDGFTVTAAELEKTLTEQPSESRALSPIERKKEALESLIRFELLAREARRRGLDDDPEVQEMVKRLLVQRLVRDALDGETASTATDAEVKSYYEAHLAEFVRPERVRVALVLLDAPAGSPNRATKAADAAKLLARAKAEEEKSPLAFSAIAHDLSQDAATRASGGDAGYRTKDELAREYSPELASAAFALEKAGQISEVVETPRGFALLKLLARQPGFSRSLDQVRPQLAARLGREARARSFEEYVKELRSSSAVTIHDAELDEVSLIEPAGAEQERPAP